MTAVKRIAAIITIALAAFGLALLRDSNATDYPAREIRALDGYVLCFAHHDWIVTETSGPCDGFTPPPKVAEGEKFVANGKERIISVIRATQADHDLKGYGIDIKQGEWFCVAGETQADLDMEHNSSALWLYIPKCQPALGRVGILQPIPVSEFLHLPDQIQSVYVGGLIEGMAFTSYGFSMPDYPVWVACVRSQPLGDTRKDVVLFLQQTPTFDEGVGSALAQTIGKRCKH